MNELSLFTGAGGGVYGSKLLGWRTVGYVEWNPYCRRVIAQRIEDGIFDPAPIFGDIRAFIHRHTGWARRYRGRVDVITGGFPCQPFSVAGRGLGEDDSRNMWPATRRTIGIIRPRFAFLENVPGLITKPYFGTILGDLAALGYDAEWGVLGADDVGAPHRRKRLWIVASLANAGGRRCCAEDEWQDQFTRGAEAIGASALAHANGTRSKGQRVGPERRAAEKPWATVGCGSWWDRDPADDEAKSGMGRVAHGVAHRRERLEALGNGQVPRCMATAWRLLRERLSLTAPEP